MKKTLYTLLSVALVVGFSYSAQAQTDPAADASLVTADTELGTADTELGTANTTLKAIQTAIEGVQTTISTPSSVVGKFAEYESGSVRELNMSSRAVGQTSAGTTAAEISAKETTILNGDEAQGALKGGNTQKQQLDRFKEIDANIQGQAVDDAGVFDTRADAVSVAKDSLSTASNIMAVEAQTGALVAENTAATYLAAAQSAKIALAIGAAQAEKHQEQQRLMDEHLATAKMFAVP